MVCNTYTFINSKIDDDVMLTNWDVIGSFFWLIANLEQLGSQTGGMVCNTYAFINSNLLSHKIWKQLNIFNPLMRGGNKKVTHI